MATPKNREASPSLDRAGGGVVTSSEPEEAGVAASLLAFDADQAAVVGGTPEEREQALVRIAARHADPAWVEGYVRSRIGFSMGEEWIAWLRALSPQQQAIVKRFPPGCVVQPREGCTPTFPPKGGCAIVMAYHPDGRLGLKVGPACNVIAWSEPHQVSLFVSVGECSPAWVASHLR